MVQKDIQKQNYKEKSQIHKVEVKSHSTEFSFTMKLHLLLLLPSASALTSIRRLVEKNADAFTQMQEDVDLSCPLSMAMDAESCESVADAKGNSCVWCPLGTELGSCISDDIASLVNAVGIPHLHCGPQNDSVLQQDDEFFTQLESCVTGGFNGNACLGVEDSACQYCVTKDDPTFGVCFSEEFVSESKKVVDMAKAFDTTDNIEGWDEVFDCEGIDEEALKVGSIADMECVTNGNPEGMFADVASQCSEAKDANGNDCAMVNLFGFMDLCVSSTQQTVFDFVQKELNDLGIEDPMGMVMGTQSMGSKTLGDSETDDDDTSDWIIEDTLVTEEVFALHTDQSYPIHDGENGEESNTYTQIISEDEDIDEDQASEDSEDQSSNEEEDAEDEESLVLFEDTEEEGREPEGQDFEEGVDDADWSPNEVIAQIMNQMHADKQAEEESGK